MDLQTRQLHEDWQNLTAHQKQREMELEEKEKAIIYKREILERERLKIMGEVSVYIYMFSDNNYYHM